MTSSEVSSKVINPRGTSFSSGYNDRNDDVIASRTAPASSAGGKVDADTALYTELWRACAGPLVTVPRERQLVYYFPQGHIEQVEASTNQVAEQQMPVYNLPSKILCRVVNVHLKAEPDTDEVFAQVTLMPQSNQDENAVTKDPVPPPPPHFNVHSFCKTLTASDTSTHGGFSVLRRHADECLPPLDMTRQPPTQELVAKDLHGNEWRFRHIFRGQPRRHLLQSGWSVFVSSKRLVAGDAFILVPSFNRDLSNNDLNGNLKRNKFTGPLPAQLLENQKKGILSLSYDGSGDEKKSNNSAPAVVGTALGSFLSLAAIFFGIWIWRRRRILPDTTVGNSGSQTQPKISEIEKSGSQTQPKIIEIERKNRQFTYSEVVNITRNFQRVLGEGAFGKVYHGYVDDIQVAVKMLSAST